MKSAVETTTNIESLVSEVADRFTEEVKQGLSPSIERYAEEHPEIAGIIRQVFPALAVLDVSAPAAQPHGNEEGAVTGQLGDFRILGEIGRGGMGVVYEAEQLSLGRRVALKVLPFAAMLDKQQLNRFKNEARAAGTLDHPNIVAVYSVGTERGVHYYAMQLVEGQSLAEVIEERRKGKGGRGNDDQEATASQDSAFPLPPSALDTQPVAALSTVPKFDTHEYFHSVAQLGIQAAQALDHAHQNGIVHRDVKPGNLLVDADGKLWVTDFGLARIEADAGMTMTGDVLGTLRYMSPEQALAKRAVVDHRTDIYSLGATLYELLALQPVYAGRDRHELLNQIAFEDPRRLRQISHRIPMDLETIVAKTLEKNPADRYVTAQNLADDLRRFTKDEPIKAKRAGALVQLRKWTRRHKGLTITAAVLVFLGLAVAGGWKLQRDRYFREITQSVRESLAAARAFVEADDYGAAHERLTDAKVRLDQALQQNASLAQTVTNLSDQVSAKIRARERYERFQQLREDVHASMNHRASDQRERSLEMCHSALKLYRVLEGDPWKQQADFQNLYVVDQVQLEEQVVEMLFLLARQELNTVWAGEERPPALRRAIDALRHIETFYRPTRAGCLLMAQLWQELGEEALAGDARQQAATLPPTTALDYFLLGVFHSYRSEMEQALESYSLALRRNPNHFLALQGLGRCHFLLGRFEVAEAMLTGAVALNPRAAYAYFLRGVSCLRQGKLDSALADFRKIAELNPKDYLAYVTEGQLLRQKGDAAQALAMFDKALEASPFSFWTRLERGLTYASLGEHEKAAANFTKVIKSATAHLQAQPDDMAARSILVTAHLNRAAHYVSANDLKAAVAELNRASEVAPGSPSALNSVAWFYVTGPQKLRNPEKALPLAQKAVSARHDNPSYLNTLGVVYYRLGQYEQAVETLQKAVQAEKRGGTAADWFFLAMAHWQLGQKDEARLWYDKGVEWMEKNKPDDEELHRFRAEAEALLEIAQGNHKDTKDTKKEETADKRR